MHGGSIIDMHCHLLPGVDDGAASLQQSLNMLRISMAEGVKVVVATPHLVCDGSERLCAAKIMEAYRKTESMSNDLGLSVRLKLGYELLLSPSLLHLCNLSDYAIEGTNRLLVEPSISEPPTELDELLYDLDHINMGLILAHPERNHWLAKDMAYLTELMQRGVLLQVNAGSIMGKWGREVTQHARQMALRGLVHLIGSDGHSDRERAPEINKAVVQLSEWIGEARAQEIAYRRPETILHCNERAGAADGMHEMRNTQQLLSPVLPPMR